jgi:hypothetical protein
MHYLNVCGVATFVIAFAAVAPTAVAQEVTLTTNCSMVGHSPPEPIGDREGHAIAVEEDVCIDQSGPFVGGVYTGTAVWEWNGPTAVLVSAIGVARKPGATAAVQLTEGKIELTMANGKVTGATASGMGRWPIATGSVAALAGKSFTWTSKGTGPGQFSTELKAQ